MFNKKVEIIKRELMRFAKSMENLATPPEWVYLDYERRQDGIFIPKTNSFVRFDIYMGAKPNLSENEIRMVDEFYYANESYLSDAILRFWWCKLIGDKGLQSVKFV